MGSIRIPVTKETNLEGQIGYFKVIDYTKFMDLSFKILSPPLIDSDGIYTFSAKMPKITKHELEKNKNIVYFSIPPFLIKNIL